MASEEERIEQQEITLLDKPGKGPTKKSKGTFEKEELETINSTVEKIKYIGELICGDKSELSYSLAGNIPFNRATHVHSIWIRIWYDDYSYCRERVFFTLGLFKPDEEDKHAKQAVESDNQDKYILSDYILLLRMDYKHIGSYQPSKKVLDVREGHSIKLDITKTLGEIAADAQKLIKDWKDDFVKYASAADNEVMVNDITDKVLNNFNVILTGAPGTGKTFLAKEVAANIVTNGMCESYDNLTDDQKKQIDFVQFHPSYDYTDFVEGLRSYDNNGQIGFRRQDGVFKKFCKQALEEWPMNPNDKAKKYVFIIDEINRGELSKIFGELFYSIDPGYRGQKGIVKTQYQNLVDYERDEKGDIVQEVVQQNNKQNNKQNKEDLFKEGFFVPGNVYIIGTMNEIDRSVEPMDFAVRRRFQWIDIKPEDRISMWGNTEWHEDAMTMMYNINAVIRSIESLGKPYCLGPAYYKDPPLNKKNRLLLDDLWIYRIEPILKEYVRILPQEQAADYMATFKAAYGHIDMVNGTEYEKIKNELIKKDNGKN